MKISMPTGKQFTSRFRFTHPVDLCRTSHHIYSDEFKHTVIYYYVSSRIDKKYSDIRLTVAGRTYLKALFSRDVVPNWTLFGGTFIVTSSAGTISISNKDKTMKFSKLYN